MPEVIVEADQPLALGARPRTGAPAPTHLHIPGSVLRGALATAWIVQHGRPTPGTSLRTEFLRLFEREVRFGPLFADHSGVVPLSVQQCKDQPTAQCAAFCSDDAYDDIVETCPHCAGPLRRGRGTVERFGDETTPPTVRNTRVQLTDEGVASEGQLHTRDALAPRDDGGRPARFTGRLIGGAGSWLTGEHTLWMGGRRSTSGQVRYQAVDDAPTTSPEPVTRRLVLRLLSPAVLVDSAGRPSKQPDERHLSHLLGVEVTVERAWTRWERLGGWHAAVDLPKPEEHAVCAGSTYVLALSDDPDPSLVRHLADTGIGLRRTEGLGWIDIGQSAWRPPAPPPRPDTAENTRLAPGMADHLVGLDRDLARWLLRELRAYLRYLAAGGQPHSGLLGRRRVDALPHRTRNRIADLLEIGDARMISDVVTELETRIRGVNT